MNTMLNGNEYNNGSGDNAQNYLFNFDDLYL